MSLRLKLLLSSISGLLTIIALSASAVYGAQVFGNRISELNTSAAALRNHTNGDMMHDALRSDVYAALYAASHGNARKDEIVDATKQHAEKFSSLIVENSQLQLNNDCKTALAALTGPLNEYMEATKTLVQTAFVDLPAAEALLPNFDERFSTLEKVMETTGDMIERSAVEAKDAADRFTSKSTIVAGIGLALGLIVGSIAIWTALKGVIAPLHTITSAMISLADGHFEVNVPVGRKDEIGNMAKALVVFRDAGLENRRLAEEAEIQRQRIESDRLAREAEKAARDKEAERLRAIADTERNAREAEKAREAEQVKATMATLASSLERLAQGDLQCQIDRPFEAAFEPIRRDFNEAVQTLSATITTIIESAHTINERTLEMESASDELSRRTEQQAASLEESSAATTELTSAVNLTADGSTKTKDVISEAKRESIAGADVIKQTVVAMGSIRESSQQITQIIGVVDEIAFQTNLLALNAGVEAARAGDSGRGFAVVATEVRALAQRSAEAAKEIKNLISRSSNEVEAGFKLVAETGDAIERIKNQVTLIDTGIADIASRSIDQAATLKQVNIAIGEIDQATQQNAAMAEHATAACRSLAQESVQLRELLAKFKVRKSTAGSSRQSSGSLSEHATHQFTNGRGLTKMRA
ncbi:MAG: methyl-accepting chemotaxis protein [Hyphomicrobium sp.]